MIKSFKIKNHIGESISLNIKKPEDTGFLILSVTGLTHPKATISTTTIPGYDGATVGTTQVEPRNIVFSIVFYQDNKKKETIEELRHKCYKYFPLRKNITVTVINDSGTYSITGYVESNEINIFSKQEAAQISIICPDPYFTKAVDDDYYYVGDVVPNFQFPVSFEVTSVPKTTATNVTTGSPAFNLDGKVYMKYEGSYTVTPQKGTVQTLDTDYRYLDSDITVKEIPFKRTSYPSTGGDTVKIG